MTGPVDPEGNETRAIHRLVDFHKKDVLEIGCGEGRLTWRYADRAASVVAIDAFESDIEQGRTSTPRQLRSRVSFRNADVVTAELERESFDVVVLGRSI
jgi:2-polyprenyl-3-methyl-5-hydroxy-6-metoxy-1,4-benzoquinol methylase